MPASTFAVAVVGDSGIRSWSDILMGEVESAEHAWSPEGASARIESRHLAGTQRVLQGWQ